MADETIKALAVQIALDDGSFQTGVKSLQRTISGVDSNFKSSMAGVKNWGNTVDGVKANAQALSEKLTLQEQVVSKYATQLGKSKTALQENSEKMLANKTALDQAKKAYDESVQSVGKNADATKKLKTELDAAQKAYTSSEKAVVSNNKAVEGYTVNLNNETAKMKEMQSELNTTNASIANHSLQWSNLQGKLKTVGSAFTDAGKKLSAVGTQLTQKLTLPIIAVGTAAVKMGMDFEKSASKVSTIADTTTTSMDTLKKGVIKLSNETGESASSLNEALYQTISAGVKTADSVSFLGTATKLAKAGFTDSTTSIDALTTVINAYGLKASDAKTISDQLIQTQNLGKTTVAELGGEIGNVIPIAASMNVSTQDLFASLAELTKSGVNTSEAVTGMKGALSSILKPTSNASKMAQQLGIDFSAIHLKNVGLPAFLQEVEEKTGGDSTKMAALFGNVRALNAVMILTGKGSTDFKNILSQMGDTAGKTDSAFSKMESSGAAKWNKALNQMKNAGIQLGGVLSPVLTKISEAISKVSQSFSSLTPAQTQMIIKIGLLVAAIGPAIKILSGLTSGIGAAISVGSKFAASMATAGSTVASSLVVAVGPAALVTAGIVAVAVAAVLIIKNWGPISSFFSGIWNNIKSTFSGAGDWFKNTFNSAKDGMQGAFSNVGGFFSGVGSKIQGAFNTTINFIKNNWKSLALFLANPIAGAISLLYNNNPKFKKWADSVLLIIKTAVTTWLNNVKTFFAPFIENFKTSVLAVWEPIKTGLLTIWNGIKTVASGAWELIKNVILAPVLLLCDLVTGNFSKMGTDLSSIWGNIKNAASTIWNGLTQIFTGVWDIIYGGAKAFWTVLANGFISAWDGIKTVTTTAWNAITQFFTTTWTNIGNGLKNAWNGFLTTITTTCANIKTGIINIWNSIIAWFQALPGTLLTIGANMFTSMQAGVNSTINNVVGAIKTGLGAAIDWIKSLPSEAVQWGKDICQGIADGIKDAAYAVGDAVKGVAQNIRKFLHFSVPDEGPLVDFNLWMPDMMGQMASGISNNKYKVQDAIKSLSGDISVGVKTTVSQSTGTSSTASTVASAVKSGNVTVKQYFTGKVPSAGETARETKNGLRTLALQF